MADIDQTICRLDAKSALTIQLEGKERRQQNHLEMLTQLNYYHSRNLWKWWTQREKNKGPCGLDSHLELLMLVLHHAKRAFQQHCRLRQNHATILLDYSSLFFFISYFASFPFLPQYLLLQSQGRECHIKVHFQHLYKVLLSGIEEKHKMWHKPFLKTTCSSQVDRPNAICASVLKE